MPPAGASHPTGDNTPPPSHAKLSHEERSELEKLEAAVGRMKTQTRPDPYLVSILQDRQSQYQYQYRSQQWQWLHNAPFRPEEGEGIQYQTFTYEEPGTNLLSRHAHHYPEERPRTADSTRNGTGSNTPAQGPKKVISFGAYKKQKTGETPTRENIGSQDADKAAKQPAVKGPAERIKAMEADSADMIKAVEEDEKIDSIPNSQNDKSSSVGKEQPSSKQAELKRKREAASTIKDEKSEVNGHLSPSSPKKTRTEPSHPLDKEARRPRSPLHMPGKKKSSSNAEPKEAHMPPKLSPLHDQVQNADTFQLPPRLSPDLPDDFHLPPRISPDLPANIRATLDRDRHKAGGKEKHNPLPSKEDGHVQEIRDEPSDGGKIHPLHNNPPAKPRSPKAAGDHVASTAADDLRATQVRIEEHRPGEGAEKASLVAKIRFKKARKEDVQLILKLPAKPNKFVVSPPSAPSSPERNDTVDPDDRKSFKAVEKPDSSRRSGKGVAQKIGPASKKAESKQTDPEKVSKAEANSYSSKAPQAASRKRRADDTAQEPPPKKRQASSAGSDTAAKKKTANSLDSKRLPSTPSGRDIASPALSSGKKGQLVSPVASRDHMQARRDTSADFQSETPSAQPHNTADLLSKAQPGGSSAVPTNRASSGKTATPQEWEAEQKRLEFIGREIKHAASALLNDNPNTAAREAAAAKCIESLICYLLAFTCSDRAAEAAGNKPALSLWRTLPPFYQFVARTTASVPVLSGLASSLAVAFHAHILYIVGRITEGGPSRDSLLNFHAGMLKAAKNADEILDFDVLTESFPKSWRGRSKTSAAALADEEPGEPRKLLRGGYKLPFGMQTDPLLAARAAWAVLKEWIANEGLEHEFMIGT